MEEAEEEGLDLNDVENVVLLNEVLHALCEKHEGSVFYSRGGKSTERDGIIFHDLIVLNVKSKISSRQFYDMQRASVLWSATRTLLTSSRRGGLISREQMEYFLICDLPEHRLNDQGDVDGLDPYVRFLEQSPVHSRTFFALAFLLCDILRTRGDDDEERAFLHELERLIIPDVFAPSSSSSSSFSSSWKKPLLLQVLARLVAAANKSDVMRKIKRSLIEQMAIAPSLAERYLAPPPEDKNGETERLYELLDCAPLPLNENEASEETKASSTLSAAWRPRVLPRRDPTNADADADSADSTSSAPTTTKTTRRKMSHISPSTTASSSSTSAAAAAAAAAAVEKDKAKEKKKDLSSSDLAALFERCRCVVEESDQGQAQADAVSLVNYLRRSKARNALPIAVLLADHYCSCDEPSQSAQGVVSLGALLALREKVASTTLGLLDDNGSSDGGDDKASAAAAAAVEQSRRLSRLSLDVGAASRLGEFQDFQEEKMGKEDGDDESTYKDDFDGEGEEEQEEDEGEEKQMMLLSSSSLPLLSPPPPPSQTLPLEKHNKDKDEGGANDKKKDGEKVKATTLSVSIALAEAGGQREKEKDEVHAPIPTTSPMARDAEAEAAAETETGSSVGLSAAQRSSTSSSVFVSVDLGSSSNNVRAPVSRLPPSHAPPLSPPPPPLPAPPTTQSKPKTQMQTQTQTKGQRHPSPPRPPLSLGNPFLSPTARTAHAHAAEARPLSSFMPEHKPLHRRDGTGLAPRLRASLGLKTQAPKASSSSSSSSSWAEGRTDEEEERARVAIQAALARASQRTRRLPTPPAPVPQPQAAAAPSLATIKAGSVLRLSSRGLWLKRFLVLHSDLVSGAPVLSLYSYAQPSAWGLLPCDLKASFPIANLACVKVDSTAANKKGKQFSLVLRDAALVPPSASLVGPFYAALARLNAAKGSVWTFKCTAGDERMEWEQHLNSALAIASSST